MGLKDLLKELRETMFIMLLKDMIKDTDEQPNEEIYRARSRWVPGVGASVPIELGCITLSMWLYLTAWKLS